MYKRQLVYGHSSSISRDYLRLPYAAWDTTISLEYKEESIIEHHDSSVVTGMYSYTLG